MELKAGDELSSNATRLIVAIKCGTATELKVSAPFRVRFLINNTGCNLYHYPKQGALLNVTSSVPTSVRSGETRLASKRTQYEIKTIGISRGGLVQEWLVYEGEVSIQGGEASVRAKEPVIVEQGEKLVTQGPTRVSREKITAEDIQATADIYASVDASRAKVSDPGTVFLKLRKLYQEVLADPTNNVKRVNLVNEQKSLGIPGAGTSIGTLTTPSPLDQRLAEEKRANIQREEIVGLFKRVTDGGGSKDYYNLALALERSKWGGASSAAESALRLNLTDRRLSATELAGCKRITGAQKIEKQLTGKPTQRPDVMNVVLGPNQTMIQPLKFVSSCNKVVTQRFTFPKLPFIRYVSNYDIKVPPGDWEVRLQFNTTGMKPGIYRADLVSSCVGCEAAGCVNKPLTQINLLVTDGQP